MRFPKQHMKHMAVGVMHVMHVADAMMSLTFSRDCTDNVDSPVNTGWWACMSARAQMTFRCGHMSDFAVICMNQEASAGRPPLLPGVSGTVGGKPSI